MGVNKNLILPRDAQNRLLPPTSLIPDAHRAGLVVHAWTLRNENFNLPADFQVGDPADPAFPGLRGRVEEEYERLYRLGVTACSATTRTPRSARGPRCSGPYSHRACGREGAGSQASRPLALLVGRRGSPWCDGSCGFDDA